MWGTVKYRTVPETPILDWRDNDCPGVSIEWTAGSILATYPFQLHTFHQVRWEPIAFNHEQNRIILRSEKCKRVPRDSERNPCDTCAVMRSGAALHKAMERAKNAPKGTPYEYLSAQQMRKLLGDFGRTMRTLRTKVHNLEKKVAGAQKKLDDYGRIMMLLSKGDVPGLRRILAASLKRGASPLVIVNLLERALKGFHRARGGFSPRDLDISFLAKALGGPKLLYALQKACGLASETTLRREKKVPAFTPSARGIRTGNPGPDDRRPTVNDVNANINAYCDPEVNPQTTTIAAKRPGVCFMWDGAALETRCTYHYATDEAIGFCREHKGRINTLVDSVEAVEAMRKALLDPESPQKKVCFATEATVVAWGSYHPTHYNCVPIVASPSCKTETGEELREWFRDVVIKTWKANPLGAATHGEIWSMASDSDAVYRYAKYLECLRDGVEFNTASGYGTGLKDLEGLNLFTSKDGILGTCDPKHIFKRFATLLRNASGFMVGQTNIKAVDILKHLTGHDGLSEEAVRELLNPADKQNVPKAVALLQRLNQLKEDPTLDPSDQHRRKTIVFLGKFFYLFVEPFINVKMSLSEQVESLSTFAHVATALYIQHQSANLTGALYADTQAVIKNIIFTIARMQEIDEDLLLHILQEGTDRLEVLFGETQDHNSNYDLKQFCEKAAIGALIHATFARNPDLDRGQRRLSLFGALGIDHVNPRSWQGNVRVGSVALKTCWDAGRARALALLRQYLPNSFPIPDISAIWKKPNHDLLRPK
ncbi:hypothetical protein NMY22_g4564 [Coprinellus aureogranulatus]|nr:hypothetical protein NMY22_g4564 [Coprinellus aureogranulatus]